jgi:hypothetical protein
VPVQSSRFSGIAAKVPRLGRDVAISQDGKGTQNRRKVSTHVESTCSGFEDLSIVDKTVTRKISIVGEEIQPRARAP